LSRITSLSEWLLRQPFVWGSLACLAFYASIVHGASEGTFLERYFASHEVEYITTALFFIGTAALIIKLLGLAVQFASLDNIRLPAIPEGGQPAADAEQMLEQGNALPSSLHNSYMVRRVREILEQIQRKGSADSIEEHLRYLEECDLSRMHQSYASVRIIVATIPILGFLGTVIGITLAIAKLSGESMDQQLPAVISGLSVAFDTTALALSLSIAMLFIKYVVERTETQLLTEVDARATKLFIGRFQHIGTATDPHVASFQRISEKILTTIESTSEKQYSCLEQSLDEANRHWAGIASTTAKTLEEALADAVSKGLVLHAEALNEGVTRHAHDLEDTLVRHAELLNEGLEHHTSAMTEAEKLVAEENRMHLAEVESAMGEAVLIASNRQEKLIRQAEKLHQEMQTALVEAAGTSVAQQEQLIKLGDILLKVVEATGQVKKLEESLNNNLAALAGAEHFEHTVTGLSAALQLLCSRLGKPLAIEDQISLVAQPATNPSLADDQQIDDTPTGQAA
jgi:biopolymer transport protein ExbB/TolQ